MITLSLLPFAVCRTRSLNLSNRSPCPLKSRSSQSLAPIKMCLFASVNANFAGEGNTEIKQILKHRTKYKEKTIRDNRIYVLRQRHKALFECVFPRS